MSLRYTARILDHLSHKRYEPSSVDAMARDMAIDTDDRDEFNRAIDRLLSEKKILKGKDNLIRLPSFSDEVVGMFRLNQRGFGFVIPDEPFREGDLFIPPHGTGGAVSRDRVRAEITREAGGRGRLSGRILEVIDRGQDNFVGVLVKERGNWFVHPDGRTIHDPVLIRDPHAKNAKEGDKVIIELAQYPDHEFLAEGVITQVLGEAGRPDVETQAVIAAHGLRTEFADEVIEEARTVTKAFESDAHGTWEDREDLTDQFIFTIDPPDAKDFDDAISIEYDKGEKQWTLGVHIADVSHFVQSDSALDKEAIARGNSVYLPRLVIPMLPEILSNGICSLQEGVARFTKSAFITFNSRGTVILQRAASTVIKSRKRLTYLEAQALIDGDIKEARKHARTEPEYAEELIEKLRLSNTLAKLLEKRRERDGMIVLNLPEVELVFDDEGHVIDAVPEDDAYTHKVIEMFMVEANEAIARIFDDINIPILRRVHPDPTHGDMRELQMYALAAKQRIPEEPDRHDLQRLLNATRDTPAVRAVHFAVLRTLAKASYSPALIGHFALASDHYAHFTSPIRRYPDLTVHRALEAYLEFTDNGRNAPGGKKRKELSRKLAADNRVHDEAQLIELGRHCSETEVEAEQAERELREFLVMQFLAEHHLGDEFEGVITGVSSQGVFISIERFLVDGLVSLQDLPQSTGRADRWKVSEGTGRLFAERSGQWLAIGDFVTVQIVSVDLASRHLDLLVTKFPERSGPPPESPRKSGHDRKKKQHERKGGRKQAGKRSQERPQRRRGR